MPSLAQLWNSFIGRNKRPERDLEMGRSTTDLNGISMHYDSATQQQRMHQAESPLSDMSVNLESPEDSATTHTVTIPAPKATSAPKPSLSQRAWMTTQSALWAGGSLALGLFAQPNFISMFNHIGITYNGLSAIKSRSDNHYLEACAKQLDKDVHWLVTHHHLLTQGKSDAEIPAADAPMVENLTTLMDRVYESLESVKKITSYNSVKQYLDLTIIAGYIVRFGLYEGQVNRDDNEAYRDADIAILSLSMVSAIIGFYLATQTDELKIQVVEDGGQVTATIKTLHDTNQLLQVTPQVTPPPSPPAQVSPASNEVIGAGVGVGGADSVVVPPADIPDERAQQHMLIETEVAQRRALARDRISSSTSVARSLYGQSNTNAVVLTSDSNRRGGISHRTPSTENNDNNNAQTPTSMTSSTVAATTPL